MSIKSEIVADSINSVGVRLTTFVLEYPRFIHSEIMTHRMFSKNSASSRAIPVSKIIESVRNNPAMPVWWGENQKGMQAQKELEASKRQEAEYLWLAARENAIEAVTRLNDIGLHKQIANRILEPWFNIRVILSGTEFENFFALRAHPDAQPEFQKLAFLMLDQYNSSDPKILGNGDWHIPFGDKIDIDRLKFLSYETGESELSLKLKIATARCARVSYLNFEGQDDYDKDIQLCDRLFGNIPRHLSPAEHCAEARASKDFYGNFRGFKQYRKFFTEENLNDERVRK